MDTSYVAGKTATRLLSQSGLSPPINPQDAESRSKSIFLLGYWRLREAGLITRQGVFPPTAKRLFFCPERKVNHD